ncbi:MAG: hypothetical protein ABI670_12740 [Chloroflexota bacterium]
MLSSLLVFFARIKSYRQDQLQAESRSGVQALHTERDSEQESLDKGYDPASAYDVSYEDALLGLEIRSFLQAEYGQTEPPAGVFRRIMRAIEQQLATESRKTQPEFIARFYRAMSGPFTARLVPGAVALSLMVAVLGTNFPQVLRGGAPGTLLSGSGTQSPTAQPLQQNKVTADPTSSIGNVAPIVIAGTEQAQFYDRVELRLRPIKHGDDAQDDDVEPYLRQRNY